MSSPWSPIHARLHRTLRQRQLLPSGCRAILAVSGGQDSLALTRLLLDLQPKWQWTLAVAHCDHRWRPDSADNAAHVERLSQQWHLPCWIATASSTDAIASEAAARQWRYRQLTALAQTHSFSHVVTGHTASDRAETLLYNLMRGSGTDGLQALTWCRRLDPSSEPPWLVRPLLDLFRQETAAICAQFDLPVWEDSTNFDQRYARNRIRSQLLPHLKTTFNGGVERHLAQTAELLRADVACLESLVDGLWQEAVQIVGANIAANSSRLLDYRLCQKSLQAAPLALQRRLLRRLLQQTETAISFEGLNTVVALITAPNRSQSPPLRGGIVGYVESGWIAFKAGADLPQSRPPVNES